MRRLSVFLFALVPLVAAPRESVLYLTTNLSGRFPLDQNFKDNALMRIAATLRAARDKEPASFYFDLGNAFYPGRLSRFSFGSLTADYLQMTGLDAGIVAAADLNIGAESLEYIRRARGIRLLSANIYRDKAELFEPYAIINKGGLKTAVIGLTSGQSVVSHEEASALELKLEAPGAKLAEALQKSAAEKPDLTVVLTSISVTEAVPLLAKNPGIDLMICGGDAQVALGADPIGSIELPDGRRVVALTSDASLTKLTLRKSGKTWYIHKRESVDPFDADNKELPPSFERRLKFWQKWYTADEDRARTTAALKPFLLTPQFAAGSVRAASHCDVSFIEKEDVETTPLGAIGLARQVRYAVQNDYNIFAFKMAGDVLRQFYKNHPNLVFSGMKEDSIIGYPIRDDVFYRVCATQRGYELAQRENENKLKGQSQWFGISDAVIGTAERKLDSSDRSADGRFHLLTIFNLSNMYETGSVSSDASMTAPPGQPLTSYFKWGLENDVKFILYNRRHSFTLNPYVYYMRQNDQVIRNLLRGDFTYVYNTEWFLKPYQRSRIDTVVITDPTTGLRPSFMRETTGAEFTYGILTGRLGIGFEKQILDPVSDPFGGIEATLQAQWDFLPGMQYRLAFDSFSSQSISGLWRNRLELNNSVIFTIADPMTFTVSHRYYYFYLASAGGFYEASIFTFSLDLRTTWKYP